MDYYEIEVADAVRVEVALEHSDSEYARVLGLAARVHSLIGEACCAVPQHRVRLDYDTSAQVLAALREDDSHTSFELCELLSAAAYGPTAHLEDDDIEAA